jgi:tetratricopeptide (TPR) repeat protein
MSGTLNLIDRLLTRGRILHQLQCDREALDVFGRLSAFHELPADVAEEAQVSLAEIHIRRRRMKTARRHLTVALLYRPDSARYHHLMATALGVKSDAVRARAAEHYRKSLEFDPEQPVCLADFGLLTLLRGQIEDGLQRLRQAAEMAPDDPLVLGKLVKGLRLAEAFDEALSVLRAARFRNPRDGRFLRLYNDYMFRWLRRRQRVERRAAVRAEAKGPTLLPFPGRGVETAVSTHNGKVIRIDPPGPTPAPHLPHRPVRRSDWKHG